MLERRLGAGSQLSLDLPSHLARQLEQESIDVGLIPAIEFFRGPRPFSGGNSSESSKHIYRMVSNACIACRGMVRSVRLFFRVPPRRVKTMAVDEGSKTSIALASILLHDRFGIRPDLVPLPIGANPNSATSDAVLVIGDRAMHPERYDSFVTNWDLGSEWFQETRLPFVFAMWVGRESAATLSLAMQLEAARDEGLANVAMLSERYASGYELSVAECIDYLSAKLRFVMGHDEMQGLKLFYEKALKLGIIPRSTQPRWSIISTSSSPLLVPI